LNCNAVVNIAEHFDTVLISPAMSSSAGNQSQALLHGSSNPENTSSLHALWINLPTPWPFLLFSVFLSVGLGYRGWRSSLKSWHPIKKSKKKTENYSGVEFMRVGADNGDGNGHIDGAPENQNSNYNPQGQGGGTAPSPAPVFFTDAKRKGLPFLNAPQPPPGLSFSERIQWRKDLSKFYTQDAERAALARYHAEGVEFDPSVDEHMDGGLGKFSLYTTVGGVVWTTIRAACALALAVGIIRGSKDEFPSSVSLAILLLSAVTYCASRAMPRITYLFLALDVIMIYGALCLNMYGLLSDKGKYGRIGVAGGICPFYSSSECTLKSATRYTAGCVGNASAVWATGTLDFPPNYGGGFTQQTDPNDPNAHGAFHLWYVQVVVGGIGVFLGFFPFIFSYAWVKMAFYERKPFKPMPVLRMASTGRGSFNISTAAFICLCLLAAVTIPVHLIDELRARDLYYFDSQGAAAQSGAWTDCFVVSTPVDKWGHIDQWWEQKQSKALRILGGV
jgi:hypothetical protein